jgi:uncharacterized protein YdgA (DUF945 family)
MNGKLIAAAAAGVVVLAGGIVGGAAVTGTQAKKTLHAAPAAWQAQWPMLKVVDQRYERGLFSATHRITLQIGCDGGTGAEAPVAFTLVQHVKHGPLPGFAAVGAAVIDTELELPEVQRKAVYAYTGNQPPLHAHTVVDFVGGTHTQVTMPKVQFDAPNGMKTTWEGFGADLHAHADGVHYEMTMPGFTTAVRDERMAMTMKMAGLHAKGDLAGSGPVWLRAGRGEAELGQFEMTVETQPGQPATPMPSVHVAFGQLKLVGDNTLDKASLFGSTGRLTGQAQFNDVKIDKFELQASVKRLHAPSYEALMHRVMETSAAACGLNHVSPQVILGEWQQAFAALLPFNPEYAIDKLVVETGGQRGELSYAVGIQGATEADAKLPMQVLGLTKGQFRGQAKVPVAWVEQIAARFGPPGSEPAAQSEMVGVMLTKLTNDGVIVRDGDMLRSEFSFEHGQLTVNGKAMGRPPAP